MPVTGTVNTFFGDFELDHSFPAVGEADKIYDLMDHQRATQAYLWSIPLVGMTRWHQGYKAVYPDYDYNTLLYIETFNERRGVLTANETTDYFWGFSNTKDAAVIIEMPKGLTVGMLVLCGGNGTLVAGQGAKHFGSWAASAQTGEGFMPNCTRSDAIGF